MSTWNATIRWCRKKSYPSILKVFQRLVDSCPRDKNRLLMLCAMTHYIQWYRRVGAVDIQLSNKAWVRVFDEGARGKGNGRPRKSP